MIESVPPAQNVTRVGAGSGNGGLNADAFFSLMLAQLREQDPTQPADASQILSQFSTISSMQQTRETNAILTQVLESAAAQCGMQLRGKTVTLNDGQSVRVDGAQVQNGQIMLRLDNGFLRSLSELQGTIV